MKRCECCGVREAADIVIKKYDDKGIRGDTLCPSCARWSKAKAAEVNGWTNYETWRMWSTLSNAEAKYLQVTKLRVMYTDKLAFAEKLFELHGDNKVNWLEIAEALMAPT